MKNPAAYCTAPSVPDHREMSVWTEVQLAAYLADAAVTATPSVLAFYIAMVATGCRPGELAGAPEDAVDFEHAMLRRDPCRAAATWWPPVSQRVGWRR